MTKAINTSLAILAKVICGALDIASFVIILMLMGIVDYEDGAWPIMIMMLAAPAF